MGTETGLVEQALVVIQRLLDLHHLLLQAFQQGQHLRRLVRRERRLVVGPGPHGDDALRQIADHRLHGEYRQRHIDQRPRRISGDGTGQALLVESQQRRLAVAGLEEGDVQGEGLREVRPAGVVRSAHLRISDVERPTAFAQASSPTAFLMRVTALAKRLCVRSFNVGLRSRDASIVLGAFEGVKGIGADLGAFEGADVEQGVTLIDDRGGRPADDDPG